MLFKVDENSKSLDPLLSDWNPKELELENYLVTLSDDSISEMSASIFGESLLLISNQVKTSAKKKADILALDTSGNGVIIELKRNLGRLGVETQALQYLADFSNYRGKNFLKKYCKDNKPSEDTVLGFLGANSKVEEINTNNRIILVARSFDATIFSLGEWLSSKGVAFRCVTYTPVKIGESKFLSFSVAFDRSPVSVFPLAFGSIARTTGIYWHNIAVANQEWWDFLVKEGQIPACFENSPGDQGERVLTKYIPGDIIVAYAKGYGAIGWGIIEKPETYRIIPIGDKKDDRLCGNCRHRLDIKWKSIAKKLEDGLSAETIRNDYFIYHPVSTSVSISNDNGKRLIDGLSKKFDDLKGY